MYSCRRWVRTRCIQPLRAVTFRAFTYEAPGIRGRPKRSCAPLRQIGATLPSQRHDAGTRGHQPVGASNPEAGRGNSGPAQRADPPDRPRPVLATRGRKPALEPGSKATDHAHRRPACVADSAARTRYAVFSATPRHRDRSIGNPSSHLHHPVTDIAAERGDAIYDEGPSDSDGWPPLESETRSARRLKERSGKNGGPCKTRTYNQLIKSQLLYH